MQLRTAAALVKIAFVPEIDACQRNQLNGLQPAFVRGEIKMSIEFIGYSSCVSGIIQQQVAYEIGGTIGSFLDVSGRHIQVIPELRVGRKVFIDTRNRGFARKLPKLDVRLQQLAERRLSREQDFCQ